MLRLLNTPVRVLSAIPLILLSAPAVAQQASAALFVETPGEMEFSGVMIARPLQTQDATRLGIPDREIAQRAAAAAELLADYELVRYVAGTDETLFRVPGGATENTIANALLATGHFQYVEPDWIVFPIAGCTSDPMFGSQWHHQANRMQSCDAWGIGTGSPSVVVAICDTGVRVTHQDIQLHRQEGFHSPSSTWENSGGSINDINGHGTLTTGCAAANGDNSIGVAGTGWNLGHRMMRVTDSSDGSASLGNLTNAARTAADVGDRVASVSYSGVTSSSIQTTGQYLKDRNALLVWAAGNANSELTGNRDDAILVVGATDQGDNKASFSNFGPFVDLFAPGVGILTTSNNGNSSYSAVNGTSFACPLTAGLAGLIWSLNPSLTPDEVEDFLRQGCDDIGAAGVDDVFGYGRINSFQAMDLANPPIVIEIPGGIPAFIDPSGGTQLTVQVTDGTTSTVPGSGRLFTDDGSTQSDLALTEGPTGTWSGSFPMADCGADVNWYVRFDLQSGGNQSLPIDAPSTTHASVAYAVTTILTDDVEIDTGWISGAPGDNATTGVWVRVDPNGTEAQPENDHTPGAGNTCWVTGNAAPGSGQGDNDVDGGTTTLRSPILDGSGLQNPVIRYWRWYANDTGASPNADTFVVDISNNGGTSWVNVEIVGPAGSESSGGWFQHEFFVTDFVTVSSQLQLRFRASDLGSGSIVEAAIDDLELLDFECGAPVCGATNYCTATANSTGQPGSIAVTGSFVVADNALQLTATDLPSGQFGIFYYGPNQVQMAFGNGFRCVGGTVYRLPVVTVDGTGTANFSPDLSLPPAPGGQVMPGSVWNYQFWHRDPAAGGAAFDLTDGAQVQFCP